MARPVADLLESGYEVLAFYGPAGTGKSMRAQQIASKRGIDLIVDDGLLIHKGRVLCGKSAKSEENMVRAIRRAMFHFPDHRAATRVCLRSYGPCKIMVLATSQKMALDICAALGLPEPSEWLTIDKVATSEEINRALYERKQNKRHVIPVGQAQIRKNFTGRFVGALKNFFSGQDDDERTIVRPPFSYFGTLSIDENVFYQIIRHVVLTTQQVESLDEVKMRGEDELTITLLVTLQEGEKNLSQICSMIASRVKVAIEGLAGALVTKVDVNVKEVKLVHG